VNTKAAIKKLNEMLALDKKAITRLMDMSAAINGHLAEFVDLPIQYNAGYQTNTTRSLDVLSAVFGQLGVVRDKSNTIEEFTAKNLAANVSVKKAIAALNHMLGLDKAALTAIMNGETPINENLSEFPDLQAHHSTDYDADMIRFLGLLNTVFGAVRSGPYEGKGQIFAIRDEEGSIYTFVHYTELENYDIDQPPV
jgi:hypothetical protein